MSGVNDVFWCTHCDTPLASQTCNSCDNDGKYVTSGAKPVFNEEYNMYQRNFVKRGPMKFLPEGLFRSRYRLIANGQLVVSFKINGHGLEVLQTNGHNIEKCIHKKSIEDEEFMKDTLDSNIKNIKRKENEAIRFIRKIYRENSDRFTLASFSGGKDSTVVAHLVKKAIGKKTLFFSNTGIEFPETVQYVRDFSKEYGYDLIERSPPNDFIDMCKKLGPPSRMMRWCCFVQKSAPINNFYREIEGGVLSFDGIRKSESKSRSKYPRVKDNTKLIKQLSAYPILDWSDMDVWLYILKEKLMFNPLYRYGYTRVGCWACPNNSKFDFFLTKRIHPELIEKLNSVIVNFAKKNGKTNDWINQGKWTSRKTKYRDFTACSEDTPCKTENKYVYFLKKDLTREHLEFFKIFGNVIEKKTGKGSFVNIRGKLFDIQMLIPGRHINVQIKTDKNVWLLRKSIHKQIQKSLNCVHCGACMGTCQHGAIEVSNNSFKIDGDKCKNCLNCTRSKNLKMACVALHYKSQRKMIKD